jgi:hypothetical protein
MLPARPCSLLSTPLVTATDAVGKTSPIPTAVRRYRKR